MKKHSQASLNPYPNSDSNKRYYTYDYYLKKTFGKKCAKIPLDGGFTCPNIDGAAGRGGCIYCLDGSCRSVGSIDEQYAAGVAAAARKWGSSVSRRSGGLGYIPYFQSHTGTYAPVDTLQSLYTRAAALPGAVALSVATRADCLPPEVCDLLARVSEIIPLTVELGLQTVHDETARRINRCHSFADFIDGYTRLRRVGGNISVGVHIINGLPGETEEMMLATASALADLRPDMVKIHLLHVLRDTTLAEMYASGRYTPMNPEDYVRLTVSQLELLHPDTVIGRVSGDAPAADLIAPLWCLRKIAVANDIDKELYRRDTWQGRLFRQI